MLFACFIFFNACISWEFLLCSFTSAGGCRICFTSTIYTCSVCSYLNPDPCSLFLLWSRRGLTSFSCAPLAVVASMLLFIILIYIALNRCASASVLKMLK